MRMHLKALGFRVRPSAGASQGIALSLVQLEKDDFGGPPKSSLGHTEPVTLMGVPHHTCLLSNRSAERPDISQILQWWHLSSVHTQRTLCKNGLEEKFRGIADKTSPNDALHPSA